MIEFINKNFFKDQGLMTERDQLVVATRGQATSIGEVDRDHKRIEAIVDRKCLDV